MLIVGFPGGVLDQNSSFVQTLREYGLGGVILFSHNLQNREQVAALTESLQRLHDRKLFIALDQEGGRVDRIGKMEPRWKTPSAQQMAQMPEAKAQTLYRQMAKRLHSLGFNLNFAPVVDLSRNPQNRVIVRLGRSYGSDPRRVVRYASLFIDAMHKEGVLTTLKHFPGHGSSQGDSHEGFTDVTESWDAVELVPYMKLIAHKNVDMVMSAHIYNSRLDSDYPATLSAKVIGMLLRKRLGYDGVVVSDDMQMGAIRKEFTLAQSITLAVNAGVDMLLFGNQIAKPYTPQMLIDLIAQLVAEGKIEKERIHEANRRIDRLKARL